MHKICNSHLPMQKTSFSRLYHGKIVPFRKFCNKNALDHNGTQFAQELLKLFVQKLKTLHFYFLQDMSLMCDSPGVPHRQTFDSRSVSSKVKHAFSLSVFLFIYQPQLYAPLQIKSGSASRQFFCHFYSNIHEQGVHASGCDASGNLANASTFLNRSFTLKKN